MKLNKKDKQYLNSISVPESDFEQMEAASKYLKLTLATNKKTIPLMEALTFFSKKITIKEALNYMTRNEFLSRLHRAAFHYTSIWVNPTRTVSIMFDCSNFFKEEI